MSDEEDPPSLALVRTLTRPELTAGLAARQFLIERQRLAPAEAIRRLTPLQAQHPPAPYVALAARLDAFERGDLEAAIDVGEVAKSSLLRLTLHLAATTELGAYARMTRQARMRQWRRNHPHLDEAEVAEELTAWFHRPRTNDEIRERVGQYDGVDPRPSAPIAFARILLPLVQLPPAGHWKGIRRPQFVVDPRPLPSPAEAAELVLTRYLTVFGPASRKDLAAWSLVPQRDFAGASARLPIVSYRDEKGTKLLDLPGLPLPPASIRLPPRFLARWDQALLAHADRDRIIPPDLQPLKLTLSGDQTLTVKGLVAASWKMDGPRLVITPHTDIPRSARAAIREEGLRTARFCAPESDRHDVVGI